MSQDKPILIKIIGPPKSRKTSIAATITSSLWAKGFLVELSDGPHGPEKCPPDTYTGTWGAGLKVKVETVQVTREVLEPKELPTLKEPPTLGAFEDFVRGHLLAIKDEVSRGSQSRAENMLQALLRAFPERT